MFKPLTWFILGITFLLFLTSFYAPSFLVVSQAPVKSDAVVLFLGGEKGTREKEAYQLVREGFAEYLIVPDQEQIMKLLPDGKFVRLDVASLRDTANQKLRSRKNTTQHNWYVEDTHSEVLEAKRSMNALGLRTALFVSSPYHMRRIKIITGKIFKDSFTVTFVTTRYEKKGDSVWIFNNRVRRLVISEYSKIIWFLLYSSVIVQHT